MSDEECARPQCFDFEQLVRDGWYGLQTPIEPAETFTTSGESHEYAHDFLRRHGCQIQQVGETNIIVYPAGTTRQLVYPITTDTRYRVRLPDGIEMREVHGKLGINNLRLPREALEQEISQSPAHNEETS
jgi:hypothetical protein